MAVNRSIVRKLNQSYDKLKDSEHAPQYLRAPLLLLSAITFQGIFYMDRTERNFKLLSTIVIGIVLGASHRFSSHNYLKAFGLAHLLNFVFNGHPWACMNSTFRTPVVTTSAATFESWIDRIERVGQSSDSIALVTVYGSHARDETSEESDLDVRIVRYDGYWNGVVACLLIARERALASLFQFPLDIYLLDSEDSLDRLRSDETPNVLVDKEKLSIN